MRILKDMETTMDTHKLMTFDDARSRCDELCLPASLILPHV
jgi:hypothetical protein